jgi:hypothetical protein
MFMTKSPARHRSRRDVLAAIARDDRADDPLGFVIRIARPQQYPDYRWNACFVQRICSAHVRLSLIQVK